MSNELRSQVLFKETCDMLQMLGNQGSRNCTGYTQINIRRDTSSCDIGRRFLSLDFLISRCSTFLRCWSRAFTIFSISFRTICIRFLLDCLFAWSGIGCFGNSSSTWRALKLPLALYLWKLTSIWTYPTSTWASTASFTACNGATTRNMWLGLIIVRLCGEGSINRIIVNILCLFLMHS